MMLKKLNRKGLLIFILILIMSGCSLISRIPLNQRDESQDLTFTAVSGTIDNSIGFIGNVAYNQSSQLTWKAEGVIGEVYVKLGDSVKKGDVLAELEVDSMRSAVILAEKTLIEAQETLQDVMESKTAKMNALSTLTVNEISLKSTKQAQESLYYPRADQLTIELAYDAYMLSVERFNYAKADYDSVKNTKGWEDLARQTYYESYLTSYNSMIEAYDNWMWTKGQPSDTDLAVAQGAVTVAQQAYDDALKEYQTYERMPRQEDVHEAEIAVSNAENAFNKRKIIASMDGTVTSVQAEAGQYVKQGDSAFGIDDKSKVLVPLQVSEIDIHQIFIGQNARIVLDAVQEKTYSGVIRDISDLGEEKNSAVTFESLVEITDPDQQIKAGMTAEVQILLKKKENAVLIPINAVSAANGKNTVSVSSDGGWKTVNVTTGITTDLLAEITDGISVGDVVKVPEINSKIYAYLGIMPQESDPKQDGLIGAEIPFIQKTGETEKSVEQKTDDLSGRFDQNEMAPTAGSGDIPSFPPSGLKNEDMIKRTPASTLE